MEAIASSGCVEIAAIADPSKRALEAAAAIAPGAERFDGIEPLLKLGLDGLVIATPSALHGQQAIAALEHGMAVFCQKPLGRSEAEARAIVAAAQRSDVLLGVDFSYRHMRGTERIREAIAAGKLGRVYAANLVFHNAYGPDKPWFYNPELSGGGCVIDLGVHLVDLASLVFESRVTHVSSRLFRGGKEIAAGGARHEVEDFALARLDFASGATAQLACSWNLNAGRDAVIEASFFGDRGGACLHNCGGSFFDFGAELYHGTASDVLSQPPDDWPARAAVSWARRLAAGARFDSEICEVCEVARVIDAIYEGTH